MSLDDMMASRRTEFQDNNAQPQAGGGKVKKGKRNNNGGGRNGGGAYAQPSAPQQTNYPPAPSVSSTRVFVGNLPWQATWRELKDHFKSNGFNPTHADVLMGGDGRSKGCGIVTFGNEEEAKRCITSMGDSEVMGRQIFVREDRESSAPSAPYQQQPRQFHQNRAPYQQSRPNNTYQQNNGYQQNNSGYNQQQPRSGPFTQQRPDKQSCRVYVGNLAWDVAWQDLKDHMRTSGSVTFAEVMSESDGRSKGCGVVEYSTPDSAKNAIAELNDTELKGRMIFVREDRETRNNTGYNSNNTSVYVGNLHFSVSWQDLKDHMRASGNIDTADILTGEDGRSKGCGIVTYQNAVGARRAIMQMQNTQIHGRPIFVREDREAGKGGGSASLYVGNLAYEVTWKELKDHFRVCGDVERADVQYLNDEPTKSKGWGTVKMARARDAQNAIERLNGSMLMERAIQVRVDNKPNNGGY
ncbi:hypothetical protein TrST_g1376 [Triparma strigata]|uniref:RRM domain-containing protein n=1 Tax=Triparma strigata TaxID=1606541 RepID=A0A9W7ALJ1_9STRA|nr:hypothetical protein TrST_g1376 [Triparma strigata]